MKRARETLISVWSLSKFLFGNNAVGSCERHRRALLFSMKQQAKTNLQF